PLDSLHPRDYKNDTELSQITNLVENSCSRANDALEWEDFGTAKDTSALSSPSAPLGLWLYHPYPSSKEPLVQARGPLRYYARSDSALAEAPATTKIGTPPFII
ncbi:uncharacterized protein N7498_003072, partial [Penicillium cinerascens]